MSKILPFGKGLCYSLHPVSNNEYIKGENTGVVNQHILLFVQCFAQCGRHFFYNIL